MIMMMLMMMMIIIIIIIIMPHFGEDFTLSEAELSHHL